jgi:hypothetical protein
MISPYGPAGAYPRGSISPDLVFGTMAKTICLSLGGFILFLDDDPYLCMIFLRRGV